MNTVNMLVDILGPQISRRIYAFQPKGHSIFEHLLCLFDAKILNLIPLSSLNPSIDRGYSFGPPRLILVHEACLQDVSLPLTLLHIEAVLQILTYAKVRQRFKL